MGFEEPERLVEGAGKGSQNIYRIGIARFARFVDGRAGRIGDFSVALNQGVQVILRLLDVRRIRRERGRLADGLGGAKRVPPSWTMRSATVSTWLSSSVRNEFLIIS